MDIIPPLDPPTETGEIPTGVLWHSFVSYGSKKETGYVGLENQGATAYLNTILQSLFCTSYFRKAVYQTPTEDQHPTESTPLALQRVFYNLQTSDQPVGSYNRADKVLRLEVHLQHDVREFNRELQDRLEHKMKGTPAEGAIPKLFLGKMITFVKCVNVYYESSGIEEFNEIELNVKGIKTLCDSFRDYVAVETLGGEPKYQAEGFGLQDAQKGIIFLSFPPVLHLQLKRYEYDIERGTVVKNNGRFEFLDETADRTEPWKYKLHGVLVHSGDIHGGQYFALIKPERDSRWLKFDDARVTPVTLDGAMKWFSNARTLVYIREVLAPLPQEDTPLQDDD